MKLPKDQPFWTSVILHLVVLIALFLATIIETFRPKEKPHVFEMVEMPSEQQAAATPQPSAPETEPEMDLPELEPVPEIAEVPPPPEPPAPAPPRPTPPEPTPSPRPQIVDYEDFRRDNPIRQPTQTRQTQTRQPVTVPRIEVPQLVVPPRSSSASSANQLTQQQRSELTRYSSQLRARIDAAWTKPTTLSGTGIAATVVFDVSATGRITNVRLNPSSGNSAFDQSVLEAFRRVPTGGPTPTGEAHSFTMTFRMSD